MTTQSNLVPEQEHAGENNPKKMKEYRKKGLWTGFISGEILGLLIAYSLYPFISNTDNLWPALIVWHAIQAVCTIIGYWTGGEFYKSARQQKVLFDNGE